MGRKKKPNRQGDSQQESGQPAGAAAASAPPEPARPPQHQSPRDHPSGQPSREQSAVFSHGDSDGRGQSASSRGDRGQSGQWQEGGRGGRGQPGQWQEGGRGGRGQPGQWEGGRGRGQPGQRQEGGRGGRGQPGQWQEGGRGGRGRGRSQEQGDDGGRGRGGRGRGDKGQDVTPGGAAPQPQQPSSRPDSSTQSRPSSGASAQAERPSSAMSPPPGMSPLPMGAEAADPDDSYTKPKPSSEPVETTASKRNKNMGKMQEALLAKELGKITIAPHSSKAMRPPQRPDGGGREGRPIAVFVNCYRTKINPEQQIYLHDMKFNKLVEILDDGTERNLDKSLENKKRRREIMTEILKNDQKLKDHGAVYDGWVALFTSKKLPIPAEGKEIPFAFIDPERKSKMRVNITIKQVGQCDYGEILEYINQGGSTVDIPQDPLRALDTMMRTVQQMSGLIAIGRRAFFDATRPTPLSDRCGPYDVLEGFFLSVRPQRWGVVFNIDKTQVAVYRSMPISDLVASLVFRLDLNRPMDDRTRRTVDKQLRTLRVSANHFKTNEGKAYVRKFTIFGLSPNPANRQMLEDGDFKNRSVADYFQATYGIRLRYPNLPCLKIASAKKTWLPMELATLLPNQQAPGKNAQIVAEVIRYAAVPAFQRRAAIDEFMKRRGFDNHPLMRSWMISVDTNMLRLMGRILNGPEATFGGNRKMQLKDGKWMMRNLSFQTPGTPHKIKWAMICAGRPREERFLFDLEANFIKMAPAVGLNFDPDYKYDTWNPGQIKQRFTELRGFDLVIFILCDDRDESMYGTIKRCGDLEFGMVTQCAKYSKFAKPRGMDQYVANLLLKINGKLGGVNWIINLNNPIIKEVSMVFGADVTHPSSTGDKTIMKSLAAVVASMDPLMTKYRPFIVQQKSVAEESREIIEMIKDMKDIVKSLLKDFYTLNRRKPVSLIFYRDGVSEGQFKAVLQHELVAIQQACSELEDGYQPGITFIVVQKRHNIRLFPANDRDGIGKSGNIPAGTVVDTDIIHPREFDFYLCSHEGIQGCSKASHYHVLWDDNKWGSDDLQKFTYYLCHLYFRCCRSVSYPAPTYYSHLAAFRAREWVGEDASSSEGSVASGVSGAGGPPAKFAFMEERTLTYGSHVIKIHSEHKSDSNNKMFFL